MTYVALLRGINVGGKKKIAMDRLRTAFEGVGMADVRTYINSGNVVFDVARTRRSELTSLLERAIESEFDVPVKVLVKDRKAIKLIRDAIPASWRDDATMRCYVLLLWKDIDKPAIVESLSINDDIDDVKYVPGAVIWRVDRDVLTRSGMMKLPRTDLYRSMTIRNCNTVRKLDELMSQRA